MTRDPDDDRRYRSVPRFPERRAHDFESTWPTAAATKCERCGITHEAHELALVLKETKA